SRVYVQNWSSTSMRFIVLNDYGHVNGGAAQVAISSLNGLANAGVDVTFVSSVAPVAPSTQHPLVNIINFGFPDLRNSPSHMVAAIRNLWDWRSAERFRAVLGKFDPTDTIIHLHSWLNSLSSSVINAAIQLGFELVCTLHDYSS